MEVMTTVRARGLLAPGVAWGDSNGPMVAAHCLDGPMPTRKPRNRISSDPFGRLGLISLDWPEALGAPRPVCLADVEPVECTVSG
jgi:hypothetical protein